jgi:hypothetical protein
MRLPAHLRRRPRETSHGSGIIVKYLEELVREWYEYRGYFVRRDMWVGLESDGTYECELDIVAFHPIRQHVVHFETSYDVLSLKDDEQHFQTKFDAGKKYLHRIFGLENHLHIEQTALILKSGETQRQTIGGGRMVLLSDFLAEILQELSDLDVSSAMVPEQWPLILTLQLVAEDRRNSSQSASTPQGG